MPEYSSTVMKPVNAQLKLVDEYGGEHPLTPEALSKLGLIDKHKVYDLLKRSLALLIFNDADGDLTEPGNDIGNALRVLMECAVFYSDTPEKIVDTIKDDFGEFTEEIIMALQGLGMCQEHQS